MLEIRYNTQTKIVTGWCADETQFGNLKRKGHSVVLLNIPIPDKPPRAWLYDSQTLVPNPAYVEPVKPRDLRAELDSVTVRLDALEATG